MTDGATYRLYAGIVDGDLAWVTPIGVPVETGVALVEGVELPLAFRPDLLKGAITGTITGVGLDSASDPESFGTALAFNVTTGETIGFQFIEPTGAAPVPFSVPYDPTAVDPTADYVIRASIFDGTATWATEAGVPVITNGNPRSDVQVTVTVVNPPTPAPTMTPAPTATAAPVAPVDSGGGIGSILIVLLVIGGVIGGAALVDPLAAHRCVGPDQPPAPCGDSGSTLDRS